MKRFFSVILAALMLAQTTALAAPTAETVENVGEVTENAQFLEEEKENVVDTTTLYEEYGTPDTFLNYDMSQDPGTFSNWAANVGKISKSFDNGELKVTPDVSDKSVTKELTVGVTAAERKGIQDPNVWLAVPSIPTSVINKIVFRVKAVSPYKERMDGSIITNDLKDISALKVYIKTTKGGIDEGSATMQNLVFDGGYHDYAFDLSGLALWSGDLTNLRIDFPNYMYEGEEIYIDSIVAYDNYGKEAEFFNFDMSRKPDVMGSAWANIGNVDFGFDGKDMVLTVTKTSEGSDKGEHKFDLTKGGVKTTYYSANDPIFEMYVPMIPTANIKSVVVTATATSPYEERINGTIINNKTDMNALQIYFMTTKSGGEYNTTKGLKGANSKILQFKFDRKSHDYVFDFSNSSDWSGDFTAMRVDPTNELFEGEEIRIESIKIYLKDGVASDLGYPVDMYSYDMTTRPFFIGEKITIRHTDNSVLTTKIEKDPAAVNGSALKLYYDPNTANYTGKDGITVKDKAGNTVKKMRDPNFSFNPKFPVSNVNAILIRARFDTPYDDRKTQADSDETKLQIYYTTDTVTGVNETNSIKINVARDGEYHDYLYYFPANSTFKGNTVTMFRFDLLNDYFEKEALYVDYIKLYSKTPTETYDLTDMVFTPANGATNVDYRTRKITAKLPDSFTGGEEFLKSVNWSNLYFNSYDEATKTAVFGINKYHDTYKTCNTLKGLTFTSNSVTNFTDDGKGYITPYYSIKMSGTIATDGENLVPNGDLGVDTDSMIRVDKDNSFFSKIRNGVLTLGAGKEMPQNTFKGLNWNNLIDYEKGTAGNPKYYYFSITGKYTDATNDSWNSIKELTLYRKTTKDGVDTVSAFKPSSNTDMNKPKMLITFQKDWNSNGGFAADVGAYTPGVTNNYRFNNFDNSYKTYSYILKSESSVYKDGKIVPNDDKLWTYFIWEPGDIYYDEECTKPVTIGFDFMFNNITMKEMFKLNFDLGTDAAGTAPATRYFAKDVNTVLPEDTAFTKNGFAFAGWTDGEKVYKPGETVTFGTAGDKTLKAVWTPMLTLEDESTASVRTAPNGIRLLSSVGEEIKSNEKLVSYGYLVARTELLGNNELTFGSDVNYVSREAYNKNGTDYHYSVGDGLIKIAAAIVGIPEEHVNDKFTIRTYADMGGETLYGNSVTTSLTKICKSYKDNQEAYNQLTDAQKEIVDKYAALYVAD